MSSRDFLFPEVLYLVKVYLSLTYDIYIKAAYVEYLNGPFMFEAMYAEDVDGTQLSTLPGVDELVDSYPSILLVSN